MRVERANFTSKNRVVRAWSIKVRVSNSSGKRKRKKNKQNECNGGCSNPRSTISVPKFKSNRFLWNSHRIRKKKKERKEKINK